MKSTLLNLASSSGLYPSGASSNIFIVEKYRSLYNSRSSFSNNISSNISIFSSSGISDFKYSFKSTSLFSSLVDSGFLSISAIFWDIWTIRPYNLAFSIHVSGFNVPFDILNSIVFIPLLILNMFKLEYLFTWTFWISSINEFRSSSFSKLIVPSSIALLIFGDIGFAYSCNVNLGMLFFSLLILQIISSAFPHISNRLMKASLLFK